MLYALYAGVLAGGVRRVEEVAVLIVEPRGTLTVLRRGEALDASLLGGVAGAQLIPEDHHNR